MDSKNNNISSKEQSSHQNLIDKKVRELHSKELGLGIPENYFSKSKHEILSKVSDKKEKEKQVFFLKKPFIWYAAASIVMLITVTLIKPNRGLQIETIQTVVLDTVKPLGVEKNTEEAITTLSENDILISSLFIEENNIDEFIDNYVLEAVLAGEAL